MNNQEAKQRLRKVVNEIIVNGKVFTGNILSAITCDDAELISYSNGQIVLQLIPGNPFKANSLVAWLEDGDYDLLTMCVYLDDDYIDHKLNRVFEANT